MSERENWQSGRRTEVTVGPAMVLVDAGLIQMAVLDAAYRSLAQMSPEVREDRGRLLSAVISVGRDIGLPDAEIAALERFRTHRVEGLDPSTVRTGGRPAR